MLKARILEFDRMIMAWHRSSEASRRLDDIPGIGPALATALVGSVADPKAFRSGRDFSAWIGLVPKQNSIAGKDRLGNISKRGNRYLRSLAPRIGLGSRRCWLDDRRRSRPSRLPTRSPEWRGRLWPGVNAIRNQPRARLKRDHTGHPA